MIPFSIVAATLLAVSLMVLAWPLLRLMAPTAMRSDYDRQIYRDQLAEIEREHALGRLNDEEAEAAAIEIKRRLLATVEEAGEAGDTGKTEKAGERSLGTGTLSEDQAWGTVLALAVLLPAGSIGLYLWLGAAGLEDRPFAARQEELRLAADEPGQARGMLARLTRRVEANPEDLDAWLTLGRLHIQRNDGAAAAAAYGRAYELSDRQPEVAALYGEALVGAAEGEVTPEALALFQSAVAQRPEMISPRFYLGLADTQAGRHRDALLVWLRLEAEAAADAPWLGPLRLRLQHTARKADLDLAALRSELGLPAVARPEQPEKPDEAQVAAMVQGLADRLAANPDDGPGWLRLGRSYRVLGRPAEAEKAFAEAARRLPDSVEAQVEYAHALFPPGSHLERLPAAFIAAMKRVLALDPEHLEGLFFVGLHAAETGQPARARELLGRVAARLSPEDPIAVDIKERLQKLDDATAGGGEAAAP